MAEIAGWEGKCGIMYEAAAWGTFTEPSYAIPLTAVPSNLWLAPELIDNNPVMANSPNDIFIYTTTGQKLYNVTGFETKFTATALQWLVCNLGDHDPASLQGVDANLTTSLERAVSARQFKGYTMTLQYPAASADPTSVALIGGIVTRIGISQDANGSRINWDMLFKDKVDAGDAGDGSEVMLYLAADSEIMPWDHTASYPTWDTAILKPTSWDIEITNAAVPVRTVEQACDSVLNGRIGITGNMTVGYDNAITTGTIEQDALTRGNKVLINSFGATGADGYVAISFPAVITDQLDGPKNVDEWQQMSFSFKGADDGSTAWQVVTCAPETTKCAIA